MDYKEKYDEALKVAQETYETQPMYREWLEKMFPELRESEDERIRKEIIFYFQEEIPLCSIQEHADKMKEFIAWLEKQEIKEHDVCDTCDEKASCVSPCPMKLIEEEKPIDKVEPKFKIGQIIKKEGFNTGFTIVAIENGFYYNNVGDHFPITGQDNWELVEQKFNTLSEEDEANTNIVRGLIYEYCRAKDVDRLIAWLLSKLQPQPRQDWSEEDEKQLQHTITAIQWYAGGTDIIAWIKSLKDRVQSQSQWKPSEEQMMAIDTAINVLGKGTLNGKYLIELQKQLKHKIINYDV